MNSSMNENHSLNDILTSNKQGILDNGGAVVLDSSSGAAKFSSAEIAEISPSVPETGTTGHHTPSGSSTIANTTVEVWPINRIDHNS